MAALADCGEGPGEEDGRREDAVAGGIAFLKDAKKVAEAGLHDKKKMSGFISAINTAFGGRKKRGTVVLQSKDYKAITNAKTRSRSSSPR